MKTQFTLFVVLTIATLTTSVFADGPGLPPWPTGSGGKAVSMRTTGSIGKTLLDGPGLPPWPK
jgi:hypothetical protein